MTTSWGLWGGGLGWSNADSSDKALSLPPNVHEPLVLDVAVDADWERAVPLAPYDGVVMREEIPLATL